MSPLHSEGDFATETDFEKYLEFEIEKQRKRANYLYWHRIVMWSLGGLFLILMILNIPMDIEAGTFVWADKLVIALLNLWVGGLLDEKYQAAMVELQQRVAVLLSYREHLRKS